MSLLISRDFASWAVPRVAGSRPVVAARFPAVACPRSAFSAPCALPKRTSAPCRPGRNPPQVAVYPSQTPIRFPSSRYHMDGHGRGGPTRDKRSLPPPVPFCQRPTCPLPAETISFRANRLIAACGKMVYDGARREAKAMANEEKKDFNAMLHQGCGHAQGAARH